MSETARASQQRQHAERKGDVGGGGNGPAAQRRRIAEIERDIDQSRRDHPAQRRDGGQGAPRPGRELALDEFALDLQSDDQEEQRHKPVIDPVADVEAADLGVQHAEIGDAERRVGDHQRVGRCEEQQHAACRAAFEEGMQGRAAGRRPRLGLVLHPLRSFLSGHLVRALQHPHVETDEACGRRPQIRCCAGKARLGSAGKPVLRTRRRAGRFASSRPACNQA